MSYAYVSFPEPEISGIELLERSGAAVVTVGFGGLGQGVCSIQGAGCPVGECQRRLCQGPRPDDPFWQAFHQAAPGEWRSYILGASSATVRDGDIAGWSWTGTEPGLPAVTMAEIAVRAETDGVAAPVAAAIVVDWPRYAGAGLILLVIGGGAVLLARRQAAARRAA